MATPTIPARESANLASRAIPRSYGPMFIAGGESWPYSSSDTLIGKLSSSATTAIEDEDLNPSTVEPGERTNLSSSPCIATTARRRMPG